MLLTVNPQANVAAAHSSPQGCALRGIQDREKRILALDS